jgi:bacteriorhodopsin
MTAVDATLRSSFLSSSLFLNGLTLITFIEALRTDSQRMRNMMNLETSVSFVASLVYGWIITKIDANAITLEQITEYRYLDWSITTPMLLLVLLMFFKTPVPIYIYLIVLVLNAGMLTSGYLGETKRVNKMVGGVVGFIFFAMMIFLIAIYCLNNYSKWNEIALFFSFALIWTLYGVAYYLTDIKLKNHAYNVLDIIAKVFFGVYVWIFYSNIFTDKKSHLLHLI